MDTKEMQNEEKWNACKGISIDWGGLKNLSRRSQPRWIENLSRIYQLDKNSLNGLRSYWESIETKSRKLDGSKMW